MKTPIQHFCSIAFVIIFIAAFTPALADGAPPVNSLIRCIKDSHTGSFLMKKGDSIVSDYEFSSKEECQDATKTGNSNWVCSLGPDSGDYIPYSISDHYVANSYYYFTSLASCVQAIHGIHDGLICLPGPYHGMYEAYDSINGRSADRYFRAGLEACAQELNAPEIQTSRNAKIGPNDVQNCDDIRMDQAGGSMEHVAVRDQGRLPICFAEVAAEVSDAWRFSHGDHNYRFQTSALIASLEYYADVGKREFDHGGGEGPALRQIVKNGSCSEAATLESQNQDDSMDFIRSVEDIRYRAQDDAKVGALTRKEISELRKEEQAQSCFLSSGAVPKFESLVQDIEDANPHGVFLKLFSYPCHGENLTRVPPVLIKDAFFGASRDPLEIANYLSKNIHSSTQMPIPLAICGDFVIHPKRRTVFSTEDSLFQNANDCQDSEHAILLIGKRHNPKTGRCEFLLRSSWGMDCGSLRDFTCEHGSIWVDADILARNITEVEKISEGTGQ